MSSLPDPSAADRDAPASPLRTPQAEMLSARVELGLAVLLFNRSLFPDGTPVPDVRRFLGKLAAHVMESLDLSSAECRFCGADPSGDDGPCMDGGEHFFLLAVNSGDAGAHDATSDEVGQ